jgi:hypothetical protein
VRIAAAGGFLSRIGTNVSVVVCAPLDCREALLAAARAGLPDAVAELDVAVRAGPEVQDGVAELDVAVRAGPEVQDGVAAPDAAVRAGPGVQGGAAELDGAVRAWPGVQDVAAEPGGAARAWLGVRDGAGAQDVLAAVPAGSRLVPPAWWAVCA